jgi:preprotein translocase subunit SecD
MRLPQASHTALLLCVAAVTLAGCSGAESGPGSVDRSTGDAGGVRGSGTAAPSGAADSRLSELTFAGGSSTGASDVRRTTDRMRARAKALGLTDVRIEAQEGTVTVTGPSADEKRLMELGVPGRLGFRPVLAEETPGATQPPQPTPSADPAQGRAVTEGLRPRAAGSASASAGTASAPAEGSAQDAALQRRFAALDCSQRNRPASERDAPAQDSVVACASDGDAASPRAKYALGPTAVDGSHVSSAKAVRDPQTGNWIVRLDFDSVGTRQFSALTGSLYVNTVPRNELAIVLDGTVISAPSVGRRLDGGTADISGSFTRDSAEQLAATLGSGALPAALTLTGVTRLPHG